MLQSGVIPRSPRTACLLGLALSQLAGCAALTADKFTTRTATEARATKAADASLMPTMPLRTVSSDRVRAEACLQTGLELQKAGQDEHAIAQFERARSFHAELRGVAHSLAVSCDRLGRFDDAHHEYQLALKESPKDAQLLNDVGMHFLQKEDWSQAERYFRAALKQDDKHPRASTNLGIALAEQQRYEEAEQAFASSATKAAAASNVAMFLARHGQTAAAEEKFRTALALEPSLQPAIDGLAWLSADSTTGTTALVE